MHLKRLESVGFKSFATRINIEFVKGMTAVVGPNGSGKSNITDAIRWVLGEQSAKSLRGSKMEDIIFQGSDSRKPLNFAEVKLVLDNSNNTLPIEYEEVSILRRIYRSGASEFYINKQPCRLKDIIDLFMDSGLGREAFSIISQGKVEEVLSSKAEERRTIFEEAAGVLKYKQRKKKAEYKLAETEENLNRVNDIFHEIDQQIEPLAKQAERAKKYKNLTKQLKKIEVSLFITEIEKLHNKWQKLLDQLELEQTYEVKLKTGIQVKEADVEKKRNRLNTLDETVEELQNKLLLVTQELEQLEGKRHVLNERLKHFSENKEKTQLLKEDVLQKKGLLETKSKEEEKTLKHLETVRKSTKNEIIKLKEELLISKKDLLEKIEDQKSEYIEVLNNQAAKRNAIQSLNHQLKQLSGKSANQSDRYNVLKKRRDGLGTSNKKLTDELSNAKIEYDDLQKNIAKLKDELLKKRSNTDLFQANLSKGYQVIAKIKSKKDILTEMKQGFQGFYFGVKNVLKARDRKELPYIHGAVIELISIPKEYIHAIETALGAQAQQIVVLTREQAREAIAWLKRTDSGRATFIPLKSIQSRLLSENIISKVENHSGYVGIAANLVDSDDFYQKVINHLMGHVIISRTLKDANEIATLLNNRNRIVTLEGDVVNPGGSMSGGARNKSNQSLFTRDSDLEDTIKKLADSEEKALSLKDKLTREKKSVEDIETNLDLKEELILSKRISLQDLQSNFDKNNVELNSLNRSLTEFDRDKAQSESDKVQLMSEKNRISSELTQIEQRLSSIQSLIDRLTAKENDLKEYKKQMEGSLHDYQVSFAEQVERIKNQREKTLLIRNELTQTETEYKTLTSELEQITDFEQLQERLNKLSGEMQDKNKEKTNIISQIQSKRKERLQMTELINDLGRELKQESKQLQSHLKMIQEKEVLINRLDVSLDNKLSDLEKKYTTTYEKAKQEYNKVGDVEKSTHSVSQLNEEINQLGSVNLGAIAEYERMSLRHEFLMEQKNDLVEAKGTLYSVISEMDEVMKERFVVIFDQIREEFSLVFIELFAGGRAELNLTDPEDVLGTGIDIIAQPPGKNLQHIGLLSGGERALTAIALLFAILRVRPVPFCVLDEVEAALDEANVVRFAKYLKQHSKDTQFIVITHRKGTMEEADVLYGVTMQEAGVSRLVSVKMEDTAELVST